jgi:GT2 family glycosyltransferase
MQRKARRYTLAHMGELRSMRTLAFFCVMFPRRVYEHVGPLDEDFGLGFFEDDDYCRRIEQAGWRIMCAEDVFVHHHLSASFGKLGKGRGELLKMNQKIYEAKWGPWTPHKYR